MESSLVSCASGDRSTDFPSLLPRRSSATSRVISLPPPQFTFPLMARSALVILESTIARGKEISVPASLATRAAFVLSAGYLAGNVPNFGTVLGLVGGVCCCAMSIAMPPAILKLANDRAGVKSSAGESAVIALVCLTGVVCMVLSVVL
jgi:proton-coupled amino acid transporter